MDDAARQRIVEELCSARPKLHGVDDAMPSGLGLRNDVLRHLGGSLRTGMRTLETGCGYSTVLFAAAGCRHTAISPSPEEHARIARFCADQGISVAHVAFVAASSLDVLPTMKRDPLDVVLIDGLHAFPAPFIDWYYTAERIVTCGLLVVDDTNIRTGRILRDFLVQEKGRWALRAEMKRTSFFEKLVPRVIDGIDWPMQPYCATKIASPTRRLRRWIRRKVTKHASRAASR